MSPPSLSNHKVGMTDAEQKRFKRQCKASEEGRIVRRYVKASDGKPQSRAELKRRHRANKAAREGRERNPRKCIDARPHEAHVLAYRLHLKDVYRLVHRAHDAHVKKFKSAIYARNRQAGRYSKNQNPTKARALKRRHLLTDSYVTQQLVAIGFRRDNIEAVVVAMKREQLSLRRLSCELKQAVKQSIKE